MVRQRLGPSSRFKVLIVATVVLCFLHLPINGSHPALAVPGLGREATRASLEKLTIPQLKEVLRGLRLKVSGNKSVLVERLVEHKAEIQRVRNGKRKIPEALKLADPATDVFIPLDDTAQQLEALLVEDLD